MRLPFELDCQEFVTAPVRSPREGVTRWTCARSDTDGTDETAFVLERRVSDTEWTEVERSAFKAHGTEYFEVVHQTPPERAADINYRCPVHRIRVLQDGRQMARFHVAYAGGELI
jgi:hypothetical protein